MSRIANREWKGTLEREDSAADGPYRFDHAERKLIADNALAVALGEAQPLLYLVSTFGHYPIELHSTLEGAEALIKETKADRRKRGMAPGEYRITPMEVK